MGYLVCLVRVSLMQRLESWRHPGSTRGVDAATSVMRMEFIGEVQGFGPVSTLQVAPELLLLGPKLHFLNPWNFWVVLSLCPRMAAWPVIAWGFC